MRSHPLARLALACTLSLGLAACGGDDDDPTDPEDGNLSEAEAVVMMEALASAGGFGVGTFGTPFAAAPERATFPVDESVPCSGGGTIDIVGDITVDDQTGEFAIDLTQTHQTCTATAPSDNSVWTFNGSPGIDIDFQLTGDETSFQMDGTQSGGIAWSSSGRSGTCSIDLTWDFEGSETGTVFSGSVTGSVCGHAVNESISIDA